MTTIGEKRLQIFSNCLSYKQGRSLSGSVNKFWNMSSAYSQLKCVTDRQTDRETEDGPKCDLNSGRFTM